MKIVICRPAINAYMAACWRALAAREGIGEFIVAWDPYTDAETKFGHQLLEGTPHKFLGSGEVDDAGFVASVVKAQNPDVIYVPGWRHKAYNSLVWNRDFESRRFITGIDTPWWDTWRQRLARFKIGRYLARMEWVMVTGERAWQSARNMGAPESRICRCACCGIDYAKWEPLRARRSEQPGGWPRRFLFLGRYAEVKALDVLVEAFARYRDRYDDPWTLSCSGAGPMEHLLDGVEGLRNLGFVQPAELVTIALEHGVLVNAARYDPWPLVIVEACAMGLPVIASEACGSIVELVRPYYNGITVPTGNVDALASAMGWMHENHDRLPEMGRRGQGHAAGFRAEAWAERWVNLIQNDVR